MRKGTHNTKKKGEKGKGKNKEEAVEESEKAVKDHVVTLEWTHNLSVTCGVGGWRSPPTITQGPSELELPGWELWDKEEKTPLKSVWMSVLLSLFLFLLVFIISCHILMSIFIFYICASWLAVLALIFFYHVAPKHQGKLLACEQLLGNKPDSVLKEEIWVFS